jgi:anti-anti-sigma regulatory factor
MLAVRPLAGRTGLRFEGEADSTVQPQIREALTTLTPAATIHLDLAGLDFIDVACTRELIALTWQPPRPRLILHDPPPSLIRIIGLLWPEANVETGPSPGETADHDSETPGCRQKPSQAAGSDARRPRRPPARKPR